MEPCPRCMAASPPPYEWVCQRCGTEMRGRLAMLQEMRAALLATNNVFDALDRLEAAERAKVKP